MIIIFHIDESLQFLVNVNAKIEVIYKSKQHWS
jgi:hypothetical protein